jgi:hypothetical protein
MIYLLIAWLVSLFLDLVTISRRSERHKDLQILLLRQQLRILQRQQPKRPSVSRWEKVALAVFTAKLGALGRGANVKLDEVLLLF